MYARPVYGVESDSGTLPQQPVNNEGTRRPDSNLARTCARKIRIESMRDRSRRSTWRQSRFRSESCSCGPDGEGFSRERECVRQ